MYRRMKSVAFSFLLVVMLGASVGVASSASASPITPKSASAQPAGLAVVTIGPFATRVQCLQTTQKVFEAGGRDYVGWGCIRDASGKYWGQLYYNFPGCLTGSATDGKLNVVAC
jgi:hypothetical protein